MDDGSYTQIRIEDGIVFLAYRSHLLLNLKVAQKVVADRLIYQKNKAYPVFCDVSGILQSDIEALDYLASEGALLIEELVIFSKNPSTLLLSKFFVETHKLPMPTAVFENKFQALNFLRNSQRRNR